MDLFGPGVVASPSFLTAQALSVAVLAVIGVAASQFEDITDALAFYGVYHREPLNQLVHFFGVPGILWSVLIFMALLPVPVLGDVRISVPFAPKHAITLATVASTGYSLFYIKIDPFGGSLYTLVVYAMYISAVRITRNDLEEASKKQDCAVNWTGTGRAIRFAFIVHLFSWYVQIHLGHSIYEGAKPAVMDSFGGALTSAPLFAFYEGLWFLGINRGLEEQTHALVQRHTENLCATGADMRVCASL